MCELMNSLHNLFTACFISLYQLFHFLTSCYIQYYDITVQMQPDKKSDCASLVESLCGVALKLVLKAAWNKRSFLVIIIIEQKFQFVKSIEHIFLF